MARYKVDKQLFEQRQLEEQLQQIDLQRKYLRNEPLKRSEVDNYNKLKANNWVRNVLISFGTIFATLVALIIFILLGALLFTKGRKGVVDGYNISSRTLYEQLEIEIYDTDNPLLPDPNTYIGEIYDLRLDVPKEFLHLDKGELKTLAYGKLMIHYTFKKVKIDDVYDWKVQQNIITGTYGELIPGGELSVSETKIYPKYVLDNDNSKTTFTNLLDQYYGTMPDGSWAKAIVSPRILGNSSFLVIVLGIVYFGTILGYLFVLVVGIRYMIRSIITLLRKAGYLVSDFAEEVVSAVKDELPIVEVDQAEEIDFDDIRKRVQERLKEDQGIEMEDEELENFEDIQKVVKIVPSTPKKAKKIKYEEKHEEPEEEIEEDLTEDISETENIEVNEKPKAEDEIKDIFNL